MARKLARRMLSGRRKAGGRYWQKVRVGWSRKFRPEVVPDPILDAMRAAGVLGAEEGGLRSRVRFSTLDGLLFAHSAFPTTQADAVFFGPDTDGKSRVSAVVQAAGKQAGAPISITGFVRMQLGEGIDKPVGDLASEVAATLKQ